MKRFILIVFLTMVSCSTHAQHRDSTSNRLTIGISGEIYDEQYWANHWVPQVEMAFDRSFGKFKLSLEYDRYVGWKGTKRHRDYVIPGFVSRRTCNIFSLNFITNLVFIRQFLLPFGIGPSVRNRNETYTALVGYSPGGLPHGLRANRVVYDLGINLFTEYNYLLSKKWSIGLKANYKYYFSGKPMYGVGVNTGFHF